MTRNIWTRALWGGVIGTVASDIILLIGRATGALRTDLMAGLANLFTTSHVANTTSGMILGFVIHLLFGALWALLFTSVIRALHSRHNLVAGIINGLILWLLWGITLPPAGVASAPWSSGTATTLFTLASTLAYGIIVGYFTSEEVVRTS
ncbi:MAG: DUF6789 family protein [Bacillota bacterium]